MDFLLLLIILSIFTLGSVSSEPPPPPSNRTASQLYYCEQWVCRLSERLISKKAYFKNYREKCNCPSICPAPDSGETPYYTIYASQRVLDQDARIFNVSDGDVFEYCPKLFFKGSEIVREGLWGQTMTIVADSPSHSFQPYSPAQYTTSSGGQGPIHVTLIFVDNLRRIQIMLLCYGDGSKGWLVLTPDTHHLGTREELLITNFLAFNDLETMPIYRPNYKTCKTFNLIAIED